MSEKFVINVPADVSGIRIDKYISDNIAQLTRSAVQSLVRDGNVLVCGTIVNKSYKVQPGDEIVISFEPPKPLDAVAEDIPLDIVYEDDDLLVVNKKK